MERMPSRGLSYLLPVSECRVHADAAVWLWEGALRCRISDRPGSAWQTLPSRVRGPQFRCDTKISTCLRSISILG